MVHHNYPTTTTTFPELRRKVDKEDVNASGLTLLVPGMIKHPEEESISRVYTPKLGGGRSSNSASPASSGRPSNQQTSSRKQRRCWSPELHRRFVDALTQLGGPQGSETSHLLVCNLVFSLHLWSIELANMYMNEDFQNLILV